MLQFNFNQKLNRKNFLKKLSLMGLTVASSPFLIDLIKKVEVWGFERTKESYYYEKLFGNNVRCLRCPVMCLLKNKETSFCMTRTNINGTLYEDTYNKPCVINVDPIEKGPLSHVMPGISGIAFGTAGCNLRCLYCQNWQISQLPPTKTKNMYLTPDEMILKTMEKKLKAVIFTYTEPVVFFDYMVDIARIAKKHDLITHCCTAAFINEKPMKDLCKEIDIFTITLKGFNDKFYQKVCGQSLKPVLDAIQVVKKEGRWFEIVNLIIPTLNDDYEDIKKMCKWILTYLGPNVPLHFARFYPAYKLKNLPQTPQIVLEDARKIALDSGIKFVYIENLPGHEGNNTYCPNCKKELIQRSGITVLKSYVIDGKCKFCKTSIPGIWKM
ncbi:MAG: AmmeMemoRadiSam system radical SAM enzyme [Candidatus Firestonebacteria bacterium]